MSEETNQADKTAETKVDPKTTATESINAFENWLLGINKQLPQIPQKGRDVIAQLTPWLALAGGILTLLSTWWFWQAGHAVNSLINYTNDLSRMYGGSVIDTAPELGFTWYIALVLLVLQAILLLMAFPKLKEGKKSGWNLLFYSVLLGVLTGVIYLFTPSYGFSSLFGSVIGAAIGFYLLFQIRDHFSKK